jgi:hypothetical protein
MPRPGLEDTDDDDVASVQPGAHNKRKDSTIVDHRVPVRNNEHDDDSYDDQRNIPVKDDVACKNKNQGDSAAAAAAAQTTAHDVHDGIITSSKQEQGSHFRKREIDHEQLAAAAAAITSGKVSSEVKTFRQARNLFSELGKGMFKDLGG